ncbi:MAG: hypothetical protein K8T10_04970 [Candidatus Eremiobacteraeota bacterium]|nr:hypothetical protein [Candidatus Eremiobacteraeota bacterium]
MMNEDPDNNEKEPYMDFEIIPRDTTPEAFMAQFAIYKKMSGSQRVKLAIEASDALRETVKAGVRQRHPEYDEEKVKLAALKLSIGDELFRKAYPDIEVKT